MRRYYTQKKIKKKWYKHTAEQVVEGKHVVVLWDFAVHTDRKVDVNRPDIVIKDFKERTYIMLDVTVPVDKNISLKEFDKLSKYKKLEIKVTKLWRLKTKRIPVVIGTLGMIKK